MNLKSKRPHYLCMNFISNPFQTLNQSSQKPSQFFHSLGKSDNLSQLWFRKNSFLGRMYTPICAITLRSDKLFTYLHCFTSQGCHKGLFLKELSSWWFSNDLYFRIIHYFPSVFNGGGRGDDCGGGSGADWEHILYLCSCQVLIYFFLSLYLSLLYTIHVYCVLIFSRKCRSDKSIKCSMSASLSLLGNSFAIFLLAKVFFCRRNEPAVYPLLVFPG